VGAQRSPGNECRDRETADLSCGEQSGSPHGDAVFGGNGRDDERRRGEQTRHGDDGREDAEVRVVAQREEDTYWSKHGGEGYGALGRVSPNCLVSDPGSGNSGCLIGVALGLGRCRYR
jgi:hypothetical protein